MNCAPVKYIGNTQCMCMWLHFLPYNVLGKVPKEKPQPLEKQPWTLLVYRGAAVMQRCGSGQRGESSSVVF